MNTAQKWSLGSIPLILAAFWFLRDHPEKPKTTEPAQAEARKPPASDGGVTSEQEAALISAKIAAIREREISDLVKRAEMIGHGLREDGTYQISYVVSARADRGKATSEAVLAACVEVLGKEDGERLFTRLEEEDDFVGRTGKFDLRLDFVSTKNSGVTLNVKFRNPQTGEVMKENEESITPLGADLMRAFDLRDDSPRHDAPKDE